MGIRWLKMGKISDRMRQDGTKMRKMAHVPSVFTPSGGYDTVQPANNAASQGPGEGMGRGKPSPRIGGDWV